MIPLAALFALFGGISGAAASTFEPPAEASHHLVWGAITLELSNNKPSTTPSRYITETIMGREKRRAHQKPK